MKYVMDFKPDLDNLERADVIFGHKPAGTSIKNMKHWR